MRDRGADSGAAPLRYLKPLVVLAVVFVAFRLPVLFNAGYVNSDGAITGLQARHILHGEWAWLRWARDYLTCIDAYLAAPFLAIFGANALSLLVPTLLAQLLGAALLLRVLRRHLPDASALLALAPVVLATMALGIYLYFNVRQWCFACALAGYLIVDVAAKRSIVFYALGIIVTLFATFIDLFAAQFVPAMLLFCVLCAFDGKPARKLLLRRLGVVAGGTVVGLGVVRLFEHIASVSTARAGMSVARIPASFDLLWHTCLPWLIGAKVFALGSTPYPELWKGPPGWIVVQVLGSIVFGAAIVFGAVAFFLRRIPWELRRLGLTGSALAGTSLAGFLVSFATEDIWAARLLYPVMLALPFALAPAAHLLGTRRFAYALAPFVLMLGVGGWASYGPLVNGPLPARTTRGIAAEERELGEALRARGLHVATATYWLAYRLAYLVEEDPIVCPLEPVADCYPAWQTACHDAKALAYVFHPSQPWVDPKTYETELESRIVERFYVHDFEVLVVRKAD